MSEERFFVDERVGCIAVRDRELTDPEYPGLHSDTVGVVAFWQGHETHKTCLTCGHKTFDGWTVSDGMRATAEEHCRKLNERHLTKSTADG